MNILKRILSKTTSTQVVPVQMDEWDCTVYLRPLTCEQYELATEASDKKTGTVHMCYLLAYSLCEQDGSPLVAGADQIKEVADSLMGNHSMQSLMALQKECNTLNGVADEEIDKEKKD